MDKAQAIQAFWEQFKLPAYDETTVPDDAQMPYITYSVSTGEMGTPILQGASLWYRSNSWKEITQKAEEIAEYIYMMYPPTLKLDTGRLYFFRDTPFLQRMSDPDDTVRRIRFNLYAEFLTAY